MFLSLPPAPVFPGPVSTRSTLASAWSERCLLSLVGAKRSDMLELKGPNQILYLDLPTQHFCRSWLVSGMISGGVGRSRGSRFLLRTSFSDAVDTSQQANFIPMIPQMTPHFIWSAGHGENPLRCAPCPKSHQSTMLCSISGSSVHHLQARRLLSLKPPQFPSRKELVSLTSPAELHTSSTSNSSSTLFHTSFSILLSHQKRRPGLPRLPFPPPEALLQRREVRPPW